MASLVAFHLARGRPAWYNLSHESGKDLINEGCGKLTCMQTDLYKLEPCSSSSEDRVSHHHGSSTTAHQ